MTHEYQDSTGSTGKFTDAQFLVFVNRILAFAVALVVIMLRREKINPINKFSLVYENI